MKSIYFALVIFSFIFLASATEKDENGIHLLTESTFDSFVESNNHCFMYFL